MQPPPALEESLFQRIGAKDEKEFIPIGFWSMGRTSVMAGVAAVLLVLVMGSFQYWNNGNSNVVPGSKEVPANTAQISTQHLDAEPAAQSNVSPTIAASSTALSNEYRAINHSSSGSSNVRRHESYSDAKNVHTTKHTTKNDVIASLNSSPESTEPVTESKIELFPETRNVELERIPINPGAHGTLESLRDIAIVDRAPSFEIGISTPFSGFSLPANTPQATPFSDVSLRVGYNLDMSNQLAFKLTRGGFAELSTITTLGAGFTDLNGQLTMQSAFAGELFFQHRELVDHGLFFITGSIGGGFYSLGTLLSAELGIQVPVNDKLMGGVSLVVSRLHQNGSTQDYLNSSQPVIYDGSNVHNTVAGSIEYGLTYSF